MKERPILFSAPMVRALLDGSKTQTRRIVKGLLPKMWIEEASAGGFAVCYDGEPCCGTGVWDVPEHSHPISCPYGQPGDRLWVREAWAVHPIMDSRAPRDIDGSFTYLADFKPPNILIGKTRPSIHMPRWASRITLEITSVRVERLQDITRGDAMAEGCPFPNMAQGNDPRQWYEQLWGEINGPDSWAANPWVWVIEFKRINQAAA